IHFSMSALLKDAGRIVAPLREQAYATPALVPASPWLEQEPPPRAMVTLSGTEQGTVRIALGSDSPERVRTWIVRALYGDRWQVQLVPGVQRVYYVENERGSDRLPDRVVVSAVDRVGMEGPPASIQTGERTAAR